MDRTCLSGLLAVLWIAAPAWGQPTSTRPAKTFVKLRLAGGWTGWNSLEDAANKFSAKHPNIGFAVEERRAPSLRLARRLAKGELDLAVLMVRPGDGAMNVLKSAKCPSFTVGWQVMAVAVHPACPLTEINESVLGGVLSGQVRNWKALGSQEKPVAVITDGRASPLLETLGNTHKTTHASETPKALKAIAENPWAIGAVCVDERLAGSGLRIVPINSTRNGPSHRPTAEAVASGTYPYQDTLVVALAPGAPPAARELADFLQSGVLARMIDTHGQWLTGLHYHLPGQAKATIWPTPPAKGQTAPRSSAVAVLPAENHNPYFLMVHPEHLLAYERAITEAIAADKRSVMVDRAELVKVLEEFKRAMAGGFEPKGAIVSAETLVVSSVVTRRARAWLVIQAMHAPTGSCLGEIRLPIDPARPGAFEPALVDQVKRWWPGVVMNLHAVRTRPVWAIASGAVSTRPAGKGLSGLRTKLAASLAADKRLFLAQYRMMPQAQREKLMRLMGLARSDGRFTPAADFVVDLAESGPRFRVSIMEGRNLKVVASADLSADQATDWLHRKIGALAKSAQKAPTRSRPTGGASAVQQAKLQLQRAQVLQARYRKLEGEAYHRYRDGGLSSYSDEDRKQLDELRTAMEKSFERAAQLDPTNEKSSRKLADEAWRKMSGQYGAMVQALERHTQYLDSFSGSPHARGMMERVIGLNVNLAVYLKLSGTRDSSIAAVPRNLPNRKLIKGYRRSALKHLARYMVRFIPVRDRRGGGSFYSLGVMTETYDGSMRAYFKLGISEQEMEEVVAEYARAVDRYPKLLKHSDFHRLRYFAIEQRKQAYIELLTAMQKRWPDPKDVHWELGKDEALEGLCSLFQTDRRGTSFYQWLRGKRGIGDLPYVGYDPKKDTHKPRPARTR